MAGPSTLPAFNPSGKSEVDNIKALTEQLMNYIKENVPQNRESALALTNIEQGAMWAVKANFT